MKRKPGRRMRCPNCNSMNYLAASCRGIKWSCYRSIIVVNPGASSEEFFRLNTVKNGNRKLTPISFDRKTTREVQRYKCKECKRTFTNRKHKKKRNTQGFKIEITRMHVEERMSFRVISKRIKERFGKNSSL